MLYEPQYSLCFLFFSFFVQLHAKKSSVCPAGGDVAINRAVRTAMNGAIGSAGGGVGGQQQQVRVDYFETKNSFCTHPGLQQHLLSKKYRVHPCRAFQEAAELREACEVFSLTAPPPYEVGR